MTRSTWRRDVQLVLCCGLAIFCSALALGADPPKRPRFEFTTLVAHWAEYGKPGYVEFIKEARPDVAQLGFYGAHFWSLAHTPQFGEYPAHFPVRGLNECGDWFQQKNDELHKLNVKVVGHFNVKFLVGDPESKEGPRGFFKFYRELWNEKELGPKPVADPKDLLEKNADGSLLTNNMYSIGGMKEYWGCLNNPHWRSVLKAWVKRGIERGVDGYVINYFYRHDCLCEHCQRSFRAHMKSRYTPDQLRDQFQIPDLEKHTFKEIASWHDPKESTPMRREMLRFSQIANKQAFDEVFVEYGRSLKPDLITAQWNHLGNFSQINGDERCMLPSDLWGKDEDYLWYSSGGAAYYTDLPAGFLGDLTLQSRYIRGAFDDKPFTMGKYESTRIRAAIAELAANGGAPMGFYTNFTDPLAREEIVRYYKFLHQYDSVFKANSPYSECLLLFPRSKVHQGDVASVEKFKEAGKTLLDRHVLFDVKPDDMVTEADRKKYRFVLNGGDDLKAVLAEAKMSTFKAPQTVRVSASRPAQGDEVTVHFVNYNRTEPMEKHSAGGGIKDEKPIAVESVSADLALPAGFKTASVQVVTPEAAEPVSVPFTQTGDRVMFTVPKFLVYSVARVAPGK